MLVGGWYRWWSLLQVVGIGGGRCWGVDGIDGGRCCRWSVLVVVGVGNWWIE